MSTRGYFSEGIMPSHDLLLGVASGKFPGASVLGAQVLKDTFTTLNAFVSMTGFTESYVFPSNAGEVITVTNNIADAGASIYIDGLDEEFMPKEIEITLAGTSTVLPGLWTRLNTAVVTQTKAVANTVTIAGPVNTFLIVNPDNQRSMNGIFSCAAHKQLHVLGVAAALAKFSGGNVDTVGLRISYREVNINGSPGVFKREFPFGLTQNGTSGIIYHNLAPAFTSGPADFTIQARAGVAGTAVSARIFCLIQDKK